MKKSLKMFFSALIVFISLITLTGCEQANIYREFNNNGSTLAKAHVYDEISYKKLFDLVEDTKEDEYIYVFFGSATNTKSCSDIQIYNEQALQYQIETVYWLDSELSTKNLNKVESTLGISNIDTVPAIWSFTNGKLAFDSSSSKCNKDGSVVYTTQQLAEKCFKNLLSI